MTATVTINGVYRTRLYINLIFFKIARGWKNETFNVSQPIDIQPYKPFKNIPLELAAKVTKDGVTVRVTYASFPVYEFDGPRAGVVPFKVVPYKGIEITGSVQVSTV